MKTEIIVSGLTSTAKNIPIVNVGNNIPKTFSRDTVRNTPGFTWYVSEHYALKSDFSAKESEEFLIMLELAFPHYVALFGRHIPGLDKKRMCAVYGKNRDTLLSAMLSDHMHGGYGYGGITQEGYYCAYQSPSNPWHSGYILLHECVHLYQQCLDRHGSAGPGPWYVEGIAQTISSYVYDPKRKQLTVSVRGKASMQKQETIAKWFQANRKRNAEYLCKTNWGGYGPAHCFTDFLRSTPEKLQKFRILQAEAFRQWNEYNKIGPAMLKLTEKLYGPWKKTNSELKAFYEADRNHGAQISWGWNRHGDSLFAFGEPRGKARFSEYRLSFVPSRKPEPEPLMMHSPVAPMPKTVGPIACGVPEPSVGCELDFSRSKGKGKAGMGLGCSGKKHYRVMIEDGTKLIVDGSDVGSRKKTIALPVRITSAFKKDRYRAGMTLAIKQRALEIVLKVGRTSLSTFKTSVSVNPKLRKRLVSKQVALLSVKGKHLITPFVDECRPQVDLRKQASSDRWRNAADPYLDLVYKACWHLGRQAPKQLVEFRNRMLEGTEQDSREQKNVVADFINAVPDVVKAIRKSKAASGKKQLALTSLAGVQFAVVMSDSNRKGWTEPAAVIMPGVLGDMTGTVKFTCGPKSASTTKLKSQEFKLKPNKHVRIDRSIRMPKDGESFFVAAEAKINFHGATITLKDQQIGDRGIREFWMIGPLTNEAAIVPSKQKGKKKRKGRPKLAHSKHEIEEKPMAVNKYYRGLAGANVKWEKICRANVIPVDAVHLVNLSEMYGQANGTFAYAMVNVNSPRNMDAYLSMGSNDGIVAWVNDEQVHESLKGRDWALGQDRAQIKLKKGNNKLFFKLVHRGALWFFSADILDESGRPISGITTNLDIPKK